MSIAVGTASWTDKTLLESGWYPKGAKRAEDRLKHYASQFRLAEVDSSYYALPAPQTAQQWAERTPAGFTFNIKSYRLFTAHQTKLQTLPPEIKQALGSAFKNTFYYEDLPDEIARELWKRFREALAPLRDANKLGAILFQFPPWFVKRRTSIDHILLCAEMLEGFPLAVEFRNNTWFNQKHAASTLEFEREHGLVHVVVDEPQGTAFSIPAIWAVTSPKLAMVRLHGRNHETWQAKDLPSAAERFKYLYAEGELENLAHSITDLQRDAERVDVIFNNCYSDYGVRNAAVFGDILDRQSRA